MDLPSRLRAIVKSGPPKPVRELTYEPDTGRYEGPIDLSRVGDLLGGRAADTPFGKCLVVDRRYEADRFHGGVRVGECDVDDLTLASDAAPASRPSPARPLDPWTADPRRQTKVRPHAWTRVDPPGDGSDPAARGRGQTRTGRDFLGGRCSSTSRRLTERRRGNGGVPGGVRI
jgi:hypothetical protein